MTSTPGPLRGVTSDDDRSRRTRYEAPDGRVAGGVRRLLWEVSYLSRIWGHLRSDVESPRYQAIAAAIEQGPTVPGAILDIGCGNGQLAHHLSPPAMARYVGVDISGVAVAEAQQACAGLGAEFVVADLRSWVPPTTAAVVVFNESLYYMVRPVQVVHRYAARLHPGGAIVVSMHHERWLHTPIERAHINGIWKGLARSLRTLDVHVVLDGDGQKHCRVARFATTNHKS